jgi:dipeptidase E
MKLILASHLLHTKHLEELERMIGDNQVSKALFIITAAVPYGLKTKPTWLEESLNYLRPFALEIDETTLEEDSFVPSELNDYGFVFVSGGNTFYLAYKLQETGFGEKIKRYINGGGVYVGSSAGSVILMDNIEPFSLADDPRVVPKICAGLGLIEGAVVPHADNEKYKDTLGQIVTKYREMGYGITALDDNQVLFVEGNKRNVM